MESSQRIGVLLGLGLGVLLGLVMGVGASSYRGAGGVADITPVTLQEETKMVQHTARLQNDIQALRMQAKNLLMRTDSSEKVAESRKKWDEQIAFHVARLDDLEKNAIRTQDKEIVRKMRTELAAYDAGFTKILGQIEDGKIKLASNVKGSM